MPDISNIYRIKTTIKRVLIVFKQLGLLSMLKNGGKQNQIT
jgi:hypothetical protein